MNLSDITSQQGDLVGDKNAGCRLDCYNNITCLGGCTSYIITDPQYVTNSPENRQRNRIVVHFCLTKTTIF